jgi:hypothetical protein
MSAPELVARVWAAGTDFPEPLELNWLYHLGLAVISILWTLSLAVVVLRVYARWGQKQMGVGMFAIQAAGRLSFESMS